MRRRGGVWIAVNLLAAVAGGAGHAAEDGAETEAAKPAARACDPECPSGQTCVDGVCMMPAARAQAAPQGYPPPQGYLPPPYPPAPGYAPQPGYPPPTGYYAQPGYAPYPGYGPGYPPAAPALEPRKRGFLAMPFLGVHSYRNQSTRDAGYDPGARFGTFLGGRLNPTVSLSGQMTFDVSNRSGVPAATRFSELGLDMAFSPLVHLPAGDVEFVLGPKLGIFVVDTEAGDATSTIKSSVVGYSAGVNAGVFIPLGPTALLGALLTFDWREIDQACITFAGSSEMCSSNVEAETLKVFGATGAVLF